MRIFGFFGSIIGISCAIIAIPAAITALVCFVILGVMWWPLTLALALYYGWRWVRHSRIRKIQRADKAELRALIEADRQRQKVRDEMVWGPIYRNEDNRPTALD